MRYKFLLIFLLLINIQINSQSYHYYVSTSGNDNTGIGTSSSSPFKTLARAKSAVRNQLKFHPMTQDIIVHIASGTYKLDSTLVFCNNDSGNNGHFVIYQGEDTTNKPVISSGQTITGWKKIGKTNIYKANIGDLYSRQVYINGVKGIRARSNDENGIANNMGLIETSKGYFSPCTFSNCTNFPLCKDFSDWGNIKDVEIVSEMKWKSYRIPVEYACGNQLIINSNFSTILHYENFKSAPAKWIENAFELLDQLNEWYIDKSTNTIFLVSDSLPTDVIIPAMESLIVGDGVKNVKFNNLTFKYTKWNKPSETNIYLNNTTNNGFSTEQADCYSIPTNGGVSVGMIPGAVSFKNASNIRLYNNDFNHIGSTGLDFGENSSYNKICGNKFEDIAASAIRIGVIDYSKIEHTVNNVKINLITGNEIKNNTITNIGNEYSGSVGIFVPFARNTAIINNTLSKFPYSGISVGWGWNKNYNVGVNNISYNRIDCANQIIPDSGGIYTLSAQGTATDKTQIIGNYILNQRFYLGGIYMDNDSSFINVDGNAIDADIQLNIPTQVNCNSNPIRSIVFYSGSINIDVTNNYYHQAYLPPPLTKDYCTDFDHPCDFINVQNNLPISSVNPSVIQGIINSSGAPSITNCN